jgi:hypothetical protein
MKVWFLLVLIATINYNQPAFAYVDTTPKGFKKPRAFNNSFKARRRKVKLYHQTKPKYDKYLDLAAEKVGKRMLSTAVGGPLSAAITISEKLTDHQQAKADSK